MATQGGPAIDPIHQFEIARLVPIRIGDLDLSFTNASLYMFIAVLMSAVLMIWGTRARAVVPGRLQSAAETTYEFVADMLREAAGEQGMKYFPLVFSLFIFILMANMVGMIPYTFTFTSHIIVTFALAMLVFLTVVISGFIKHGPGFLKLFVLPGVPLVIMPVITIIELISFISRPISHSVRLFANMLAGHITLKVFGGFVVMLLGAGGWAVLSPLPLIAAVALTGLEFLVAFLQAYVFTMLTCMYINDAIHPGH